MSTGFAICKIEGGTPTWWGQITPEEWATMSSSTLALTPDGKFGLCMATGPATTVAKVAGLTDVLPIGIKTNMDANVPLATRNAVNTWLSNKGFTKSFPVGTSAIQMLKAIGKAMDGVQQRFVENQVSFPPDPDDEKDEGSFIVDEKLIK